LLLGWHYLAPDEPVSEVASNAAPLTSMPAAPLLPVTQSDQSLPSGPAIVSQQGTEVDGLLEVDQQGNLLITEQIRHLFDYFYTTVGEVSFDQATDNIRQHLRGQLQQPALGQALALLDDYIEYKTALVELEQAYPVIADIDGLRARGDAVQRLRAGIFSAEAHRAFFAADEVFDQFSLARLAILHDANIPAEDKGAMIESLRQGLPEDMQDLLVPQIHQVLTEQTQALQSEGADAAQIRELRMSLVGPEATGRLETLDTQRQQWRQRVEAFNAERRSIIEHPGLAEADKQQAIEDLASQRFAPNERLRLASLIDDTD
jgi:lipase chaperone LimK